MAIKWHNVKSHLRRDRKTWIAIEQYARDTNQKELAHRAKEEARSDERLIKRLK